MAEERKKSRDAADIIREKTKEEMGLYIREKEKVRYPGYSGLELIFYSVCGMIK